MQHNRNSNKTADTSLIYGMRPIFEAIESGKTIDKVLFQKDCKASSSKNFSMWFVNIRSHSSMFHWKN